MYTTYDINYKGVPKMVEYLDYSFSYPNGKQVLHNVNLNISTGDFVVLFGSSGCGKTTLIKQLLSIAPNGSSTGSVLIDGVSCDSVPINKVGYVSQSIENQIVTDKVWHELAFGLESMGVPSNIIRSKVMETATYFGIDTWYDKSINELSGGQRQILMVASIMVTNPEILILDEPTSQLDAVSINELMSMLERINKDLGVTIIIIEHSLDYVFSYANRLVYIQDGVILHSGSKLDTLNFKEAIPYLSPYIKVAYFQRYPNDAIYVSNFRREFLKRDYPKLSCNGYTPPNKDRLSIQIKSLYYKYSKEGDYALNGIDLKLYSNQITSIIGPNGSGKSTLTSLIVGALKSKYGKVKVLDTICCLPQDVQTVFCKSTVYQDLLSTKLNGIDLESSVVTDILDRFGLLHLKDCHPYDLSGGEQQMLGIAKVLLLDTNILVLDEPTKCLDVFKKAILKEVLVELANHGKTVILISHDLDYVCEVSNRLIVMFKGEVVSDGSPKELLSANRYFTTSIGRVLGSNNRGYLISKDFDTKGCLSC